jgi:hypothetical protein
MPPDVVTPAPARPMPPDVFTPLPALIVALDLARDLGYL